MPTPRRLAGIVAIMLGITGCATEQAVPPIVAVMQAEDSRAGEDSGLAVLRGALESPDAAVRSTAVRALGRLEQPAHLPDIARMLGEDPDPDVRATAAWAAAQAMKRGPGNLATVALYAAFRDDVDARVRAAAATSLGRLTYESREQVGEVLTALLETQAQRTGAETIRRDAPPSDTGSAGDADETTLLGTLRGIEVLLRSQPPEVGLLHPSAAARMRELIAYGGEDALTAGRIRALALAVLIRQGVVDDAILNIAMADPEPEVRRRGATAIGQIDGEWQSVLLDRGTSDPDPRVRLETLRAGMPREDDRSGCTRLKDAVDDRDAHVRLLAIDGLRACPGAVVLLQRLAEEPGATWHPRAHALLSLAELGLDEAAGVLPAFTTAQTWQSRMYAARAATRLGNVEALAVLAHDLNANVREAAVRGLAHVAGPDAGDHYLAALGTDDPQLLMTTAGALADTRQPRQAVARLLEALERISIYQRQTDRDARAALLERVGALADATLAARVERYLTDYDPEIATQAATILEGWTGVPHPASPQPLPSRPFPTLEQIQEMEAARVTMTLVGVGSFELRLLPWEAPTNAARFVELARAGHLDGLSFHRVVPNFVIQGGSPGANEYSGHGAYTRDEVGDRSHLRGTVGISTRGRDTGDGQIFINLVDNLRLDHEYTIFAEVVDGIDTVDAILEGAEITSVTIVIPR